MIDTINCTNCGLEIKYNIPCCECGYYMPENEKKEILNLINRTNTVQLFNKRLESSARGAYLKLDDYSLDSKYYRSKTAKKDFEKKNNFIKEELVPKVITWREKVIDVEKRMAKERLEVYGRIYQITDFIINDFFGKFKFNDTDHNIKIFLEMRDFSKYEIEETLSTSDLDFSDIETTDLGSNILSSGFNALANGSFVELSEKSEWSKSDKNRVAAEVGIAVGMEIINGISNVITKNSKIINHVRESDLQLNTEMEKLMNVISGLSIEQSTLIKNKRLYDRCDLVLDFTYKYKLLPIINELVKNPIFIEYKNKRRPYDLEQEKIQINETVLNEKISLSFWGSLLKGKNANFKSSWKRRIQLANLEEKYTKINLELNESSHTNFNQLIDYKSIKDEYFKDFEKKKENL
ncbi:hypothetical protein [Winogradskyella psychrotolerans]|uniref:hypothetical protein n=1 Tax=Winogradskyella psychrotolerans TaxID=1344585 RepID=UPI000593E7F2|nr:hypothetical protein [Winogradskyella psychrotolerans]